MPRSTRALSTAPGPWGLSWITAMFLHGGWDRILGNMLFLTIFGKKVEDAFRSLAHLVFYFAAMMTQTAMTLLLGPAQAARVPELGASGAVAAVLDAHFVLYPGPQILTYIFAVLRGVPRPRRRVHRRPAGGTAPCPGGQAAPREQWRSMA